MRFQIMPVHETFGQFQARLQPFMPTYQTALSPRGVYRFLAGGEKDVRQKADKLFKAKPLV